MIHDEILEILAREGPLTGGELHARAGGDRFLLWKACVSSPALTLQRIGDRYLRLDERLPRYCRLSPSILREFLTYTVVGTDATTVQERATILREGIREIGQRKADVARAAILSVMDRMSQKWREAYPVCFVLGGDIAYGMAHCEPRPEHSTGRMVRGSDLDIVVVLDDPAPEAYRACLEEEMHREKYRLLVSPATSQELDYVVKKVEKFREQLGFDTFKRMIACKIMREGSFLGGDRKLFDGLKLLLARSGVIERIAAMEERALAERVRAEESLRHADEMDSALSALFYSSQESEEFE